MHKNSLLSLDFRRSEEQRSDLEKQLARLQAMTLVIITWQLAMAASSTLASRGLRAKLLMRTYVAELRGLHLCNS